MAPRATTSLATNAASKVVAREEASHGGMAARGVEGGLGDQRLVDRQPGPAQCRPVAGEPFLRGGVDERRVRDAGDPPVTQRDQVLHGTPRTGHVVDVDAGHRDIRQRPLEDDREPVADELEQRWIVDARTRDDEPIGVLGAEEVRVRRVRTVGRKRLDHDPEAVGPRRGDEPAEGLGQDGVAGDLLGRSGAGPARRCDCGHRPAAGRRMRVIAEAIGGGKDALDASPPGS